MKKEVQLEADPASERKVIERYFPKESQVLVFDTIISAKELEIKIEQRSTDTYVLNEFETGKDKYRDKYRDFEIGLLIKQRDSTLLDTVLNKMSYLDKSSDIFLNEAIFLNYSFDGISNDSIKFSGGINKPETDWYLELKHSYSIKSKMLELIEWTFN